MLRMNKFVGFKINADLNSRIEEVRHELGYSSFSSCIRFLVEKGLSDVEKREVNHHLLHHSCQTVFLARELLKVLSPGASEAAEIADRAKRDAEHWLSSYTQKVEG